MKRFVWMVLLGCPVALGAQQPHDTMHAAHRPDVRHDGMTGVLGISMAREGSGTAWLPDRSPMYAQHGAAGAWNLMLHANLFLQYIDEGSDRGDDQLGSINWLMGMATRPLAGGEIALRGMLSAERWTTGKCGYPDLLATGETCNGEPIHDRQHPHDLFMELAVAYRRALGNAIALELYGGPVAEPALGPVAYPHRISAFPGPLAPITHHWLDATHITFGSVTAGLFGRAWKVEGSVFNGREPDENRTDLDLARMDSYSGRITWLPDPRLAFQVSAGLLNEAEPGHGPGEPRVDVTRYTASATMHQPVGGLGLWATSVAFGRNVEEEAGTNAVLTETSLNLGERHILSARAEWVEKSGHDLALEDPALEDRVFSIAKAGIGYTIQLPAIGGWMPGLGAGAAVSFLPADLEPAYGGRRPVGFVIFAGMRPASMRMEEPMSMPMPMGAGGVRHDHR